VQGYTVIDVFQFYRICTRLQVCKCGTGGQEYYSGTELRVGQVYMCTGIVYVFRATVVLQIYTGAEVVQEKSDTIVVQV